IVLSQTPAPGTDLAIGSHTITITGEDEAGNTSFCNFTLNVADLTDPTVLCPSNQNIPVDVNCTGSIGSYIGLSAVNDDCSLPSSITVTQNPAPGTIINQNTQIFLTATDEAGNSASCNFFALTIDNTDPVVTCPTSLSVPINSSCQLVVPDLSGQISASDNCSALSELSLTQNPLSGTLELGLTAVLLTITDEQGNQGTCVTLLVPDDNEIPAIACPNPTTIDNGNNCDFTLPNYAANTLVLDNCSGFTITQNPPAGTVVQAGPNTIEMEVSDVAGNIATCSFTINIIENSVPNITCPNNITTCDPVVTYGAPAVMDNCSATFNQIDASGLTSGDFFPVGSTVQEFEVEDLSGNSSTCSFIVTVLDYPAQSTIIEDTIGLCDATSTLIGAQPHTTGTGEWSVSQGTGNFNNQFATTTGVNNLTYGTNILVYTISTLSCGSTSDSVYVIASQSPLPASTQDSLNACNSPEISLISNTPLYGVGEWSTNDPSAEIVAVNSSNTTATNLTAGYHNYIWTISNGICPSTSDTLIVYVPAQANIDQPDTAFCLEDGALNLSATATAPVQTSYWMFIQGSGNFDTPGNNSTSVNELDLGNNTIIYVMEHPNCENTSDTITIIASLCDGFDPVFPTVITPNLDGKNDLFVINFLEKVYPDCRVTIFNRWGSVVFESVGYEEPWDGTFKGETLPLGTYFYRIELNDDANTVYDGPISIIK
ncbi:MAG: HYR domain-containing protein, partial [Bacteroidota bacterium]